MKIKLAVYTAQEGYSWQPGSAITADQLRTFKACIGKFPSPDADDFPFGGIFLKDGLVVFYRYHVAKKIDFRGRDALYCVLGVVSVHEAAEIDPEALFSLPQFAAPMRPFPTEAELPASCQDRVPDWLKSLDDYSLDVRISMTSGGPHYDVQHVKTKRLAPPSAHVLPVAPSPVPVAPCSPVTVKSPEPRPFPRSVPSAHDIPQIPSTARSTMGIMKMMRRLYRRDAMVLVAGICAVLVVTAVFVLVRVMSGNNCSVPRADKCEPVLRVDKCEPAPRVDKCKPVSLGDQGEVVK